MLDLVDQRVSGSHHSTFDSLTDGIIERMPLRNEANNVPLLAIGQAPNGLSGCRINVCLEGSMTLVILKPTMPGLLLSTPDRARLRRRIMEGQVRRRLHLLEVRS